MSNDERESRTGDSRRDDALGAAAQDTGEAMTRSEEHLVAGTEVRVELTADQSAELRALTTSAEVSAAVGTRARIVLWHAEGWMKKDIAGLAGVSRPTVDLWLTRYAANGAASLLAAKPGGPREQVVRMSAQSFWR